jgi:hypothetical protein
MTRHVTLYRRSQRRTDEKKIREQINQIVGRGLGGSRARYFKLIDTHNLRPTLNGNDWVYAVKLTFQHTGRGDCDAQFGLVTQFMETAARSRGGWSLMAPEDKDEAPAPTVEVVEDDLPPPAQVTIDKDGHFDHLYGLDAQINIVLDALQVAKDTNQEKRYHSVLWGKPGCGKSEILQGIKRMVGEGNYMEFDGTQTTAAGAIRALVDAPVVPSILIIEEIEKVPDAPFLWLLSALDGRAEIRKTTNHGMVHRKVPFVCVATVNDLELFKARHDGAMASRFSHNIYCPRPDAKTLHKILTREIESIDGNPDWIAPALEYCIAEEKNTDPRRVIAVCLTGRDRLLSGEFQRDLMKCRPKES